MKNIFLIIVFCLSILYAGQLNEIKTQPPLSTNDMMIEKVINTYHNELQKPAFQAQCSSRPFSDLGIFYRGYLLHNIPELSQTMKSMDRLSCLGNTMGLMPLKGFDHPIDMGTLTREKNTIESLPGFPNILKEQTNYMLQIFMYFILNKEFEITFFYVYATQEKGSNGTYLKGDDSVDITAFSTRIHECVRIINSVKFLEEASLTNSTIKIEELNEIDKEDFLNHLQTLSDLGFPIGQSLLGYLYEKELLGINKSDKDAEELYKKAFHQKHSFGSYLYGLFLYNKGLFEKAFYPLLLAAELGCVECRFLCEKILEENPRRNITDEDIERYFNLFEELPSIQ